MPLTIVSLRGAKKISSLVIARSEVTKQSLTKRLRLRRRYAPRNDNLLHEIATLRSQRRIAPAPVFVGNDEGSSNMGIRLNYK
jgi:hypothetical protein